MSNPTTATTEIYLLSLHDAFRSGPRLHEMCVEDMDPHRLEHVDEADEPGEVRLVEMRWREVSGEQGKALREVLRLRRQLRWFPSEPRQVELRVVESGLPQLFDLFRERLATVRRSADAHGRTNQPACIRFAARLS